MNEAFLPGTRLMRTTSATHRRAEKSTTYPLASAPTCRLFPGSGTYRSALPIRPALWTDLEQTLSPWSRSCVWETQSLHRSLLELLCELCAHSSLPFWGDFPQKILSEAAQFGPGVPIVSDTVL